ncbi:MAG: lipid-A-disaccharide synthase [Blastochloris viridis]|uniref:Lipid-A-disaccharide synthase n=1 Tax=Blastochloris viridis TaxID=1079 RepID=A0A6N4RBV2_BLAVI|nr:MAG: lipid-A-disaccharide synthase [Blastochloris viridis]
MPHTILIVAGEASGDRLGGALMAELKQIHPALRFIGVGGEHMYDQGLQPVFPMTDLAVMGLIEVIPAIPRILKRLSQLEALVKKEKPSLIITIDSQDFSSRLAKRVRILGIPHIQYVAPKVWAWRQGRAHKLRELYTHLLTILPFEQGFFQNYGMKTNYVGHPAITMLEPYVKARSEGQKPVIALLPGSRGAELKRHWPIFLQTYRNLRQRQPNLSAVLALPNRKTLEACQAIAPWESADLILPVFGEERFHHLATATAALTKSGTNNLELALLGIPAIVTYRMNALTYLIARLLVKVPYISLPNLILHNTSRRVAYPEYIQGAANTAKLTEVMTLLLTGTAARDAQIKALGSLKALMATPKPPPLMAAEVVGKYIK